MTRYRAIIVHQPWAWAICAGLKRVENRTWISNYRGPLAIHAGTNRDRLKTFLAQIGPRAEGLSAFPTAVVVGVVKLADVAPISRELESDPSAIGPYCWLCDNPRLLNEPVPVKGKTSLFYVPEAESAQIAAQLRGATSSAPPLQVPELTYEPWDLQISRGESYWALEKDEDAMRCFDNAVDAAPDEAVCYRVRGYYLAQCDLLAEAKADLEEAIELDPCDALSHQNLGAVYKLLGDGRRADINFKRSRQLDPKLGSPG